MEKEMERKEEDQKPKGQGHCIVLENLRSKLTMFWRRIPDGPTSAGMAHLNGSRF